MEKQTINGIPRRIILSELTAEELHLYKSIQLVEEMGAHPLLTDVINKIHEARGLLADYVELKSKTNEKL